ncbi:MAG: (2Fe-2S)-binding protein [Gammaproteobacteria bacterium]|nr:(2Fe-2S)-binding protein [Gammaproteobacteria bacterium]
MTIVKNPLEKLPDIYKQDLERNLCVCNEVQRLVVINVIANGAKTVEEVTRLTYAADGNACCKRQVQRLIDHIWAE